MTIELTRRAVLRLSAMGAAGLAFQNFSSPLFGAGLTSRRPDPGERKFTSPAVEAKIAEVKKFLGPDSELAWLFENCYPNTLDTTVRHGTLDGKPDTFVITGDIPAM